MWKFSWNIFSVLVEYIYICKEMIALWNLVKYIHAYFIGLYKVCMYMCAREGSNQRQVLPDQILYSQFQYILSWCPFRLHSLWHYVRNILKQQQHAVIIMLSGCSSSSSGLYFSSALPPTLTWPSRSFTESVCWCRSSTLILTLNLNPLQFFLGQQHCFMIGKIVLWKRAFQDVMHIHGIQHRWHTKVKVSLMVLLRSTHCPATEEKEAKPDTEVVERKRVKK